MGNVGTVEPGLKRQYFLRYAGRLPCLAKRHSQQHAATTFPGHAGKVSSAACFRVCGLLSTIVRRAAQNRPARDGWVLSLPSDSPKAEAVLTQLTSRLAREMQITAYNSSSGPLRMVGDIAFLLAAVLAIGATVLSCIRSRASGTSPQAGRERRLRQVDRLLKECNRAIDTSYPVEKYRGQKRLLSPTERAALLLASELGLVEAHIAADQLTLKFPASDDMQHQREVRRRLSRWFNLPTDYWTANQGLQIPTDFNPDRPTLLVIHGLEAVAADLASLSTVLVARPGSNVSSSAIPTTGRWSKRADDSMPIFKNLPAIIRSRVLPWWD